MQYNNGEGRERDRGEKLLLGGGKEGRKKEDLSKPIHCYPAIVSKIQTWVARTQALCEKHTS